MARQCRLVRRRLCAGFKAFVAKMRSRFPGIKRIELIDEGNKLNDLIAPWRKETPGLTYIDTRDLTLGPDGKPRAGLFMSDMTP